MFYNKDKAEEKPEAEPSKAPAKKGAQKKEKDPVEAKQDEEAVAKKKPKGRPAANKANEEEPGIYI